MIQYIQSVYCTLVQYKPVLGIQIILTDPDPVLQSWSIFDRLRLSEKVCLKKNKKDEQQYILQLKEYIFED